MTIASATQKVSFTGNGSLDVYAYSFKIFATSDLQVVITSTAGVEATKTLGTHFNVSGAGSASGGNVTFTAGNVPASGELITISRQLALTQPHDYVENDSFGAEDHEESLDRLVGIAQQLNENANRTVRAPISDTGISMSLPAKAARASKIFAFDAAGNPETIQEVGTYRGDWAASTLYALRDIVKDTSNSNIYIVTTAHTSSGSQPLSSNADSAKWTLIVDAAAAGTSAAAAATSAAAAATSATAGASSATAGASSATASASSASTASTQASNASTSATESAASAAAAAASADAFDDTYLGAKSSAPTVDNDGAALTAGDLYFNTSTNVMHVYTGSAWIAAALSSASVVERTAATGSGVTPSGTTGQRDGAPAVGYFRYNSTTNEFEGYSGASPAWGSIGGGAGYFKGDNGTVGSSAGDIFRINEAELNTSTEILAAENASAAGPLTIASGVTLTVSGNVTII